MHTHGTHEFYNIRSQLTKYLIENRGYNLVLLEGEWNALYPVNKYVNNLNNNLNDSMSKLDKYPKWMWNNEISRELFKYIREHNIKYNDKINILGMDCQSFYPSLGEIFTFLDKIDPDYSVFLHKKLSFFLNIQMNVSMHII